MFNPMKLFRSAIVPLAIGLAPVCSAWADEVVFSLADSGRFDAVDPNTVIGTRTTDQLADLLYSAHAFPYFYGETAAGFLSFELGTFTLNRTAGSYAGHTFTLGLLFVTPKNLTGGNAVGSSATATAALLGDPAGTGEHVMVDFDNAAVRFTFQSANASGREEGTFDLTLDDVFVPAGATVRITGHITNAFQQQVSSIPEPSALVLLVAGLAGTASVRRRLQALRSRRAAPSERSTPMSPPDRR